MYRVSGVGASLSVLNFMVQRIIGLDRRCPYQKHFTSRVLHAEKLLIEAHDASVLRSLAVSGGCYINAYDGIRIGTGTIWGPNVCFVSQDHERTNLDEVPPTSGIVIGRDCWIGAGTVILPGTSIAAGTIVGANSVVSGAFSQPRCLIAGAPATVRKSYGQTSESS